MVDDRADPRTDHDDVENGLSGTPFGDPETLVSVELPIGTCPKDKTEPRIEQRL